VAFVTVTLTLAVLVPPVVSRAIAVSVCVPFGAVVEFQTTEYGAVVSSAPMFVPSTLNWTPAIPIGWLAVAETVTLAPETVAPFAGAVSDTVGFAPLTTVIVNEAVLVFVRASVALQVTVVVPIGNVVPLAGAQLGVIEGVTASTAVTT
jgi:hypothetical protein